MRLNAVYWIRGAEYAAMAARSAASVKRVYDEARVIVYADAAHTELDNPIFDTVLVLPGLNNMPAMVANLNAQVHYCFSEQFCVPTLFLDADVLAVQKPAVLEGLMAANDLLVTARDHVGIDEDGNKVVGVANVMPYNYGVTIASPTHAARECYVYLREKCARYGQRLQNWYGNQYALADLVGGGIRSDVPRFVELGLHGWPTKIVVESCDQWNYTPQTAGDDLASVYFVHPKGDRKDVFEELAEFYA